MSGLTRRGMLASVGVAAVGGLAGCANASGDEVSGARLGSVAIENLHDEPHELDVIVEFDDTIEHWSTHELAPDGAGAVLERSWPAEAGPFQVTTRLDGEHLSSASAARWDGYDCLDLVVVVGREGEISILVDTDGGSCPGSGTPTDG